MTFVSELTGFKHLPFAGESFVALPHRALFWPVENCLLIADLHLGKPERFQQSGLAVPVGSIQSDLNRLSEALRLTEAKRLLILGDFCHSVKSLTKQVEASWLAWKKQHNTLEVTVILGNHDRGLQPYLKALEIEGYSELLINRSIRLCHEPEEDGTAEICGHLHPVLKLQHRRESLRLPCFAIKKYTLILPAFSEFTGGYSLKPEELEAAYLVTDSEIIPWE